MHKSCFWRELQQEKKELSSVKFNQVFKSAYIHFSAYILSAYILSAYITHPLWFTSDYETIAVYLRSNDMSFLFYYYLLLL